VRAVRTTGSAAAGEVPTSLVAPGLAMMTGSLRIDARGADGFVASAGDPRSDEDAGSRCTGASAAAGSAAGRVGGSGSGAIGAGTG
jgi:hypothetical protein